MSLFDNLGHEPWQPLRQWYNQMLDSIAIDPNAIFIATAAPNPSVRTVLLKAILPNKGLVFYTNYNSRKAQQLAANPNIAMLLYHREANRQIRIEGSVSKASQAMSALYFATRPRNSQIGAWASKQSQPMQQPDSLEQRFAAKEQAFADGDIPLPPFWGGYMVTPTMFEFWQGQNARLHQRVTFTQQPNGWHKTRLYP